VPVERRTPGHAFRNDVDRLALALALAVLEAELVIGNPDLGVAFEVTAA
jgi:hypothetical protein